MVLRVYDLTKYAPTVTNFISVRNVFKPISRATRNWSPNNVSHVTSHPAKNHRRVDTTVPSQGRKVKGILKRAAGVGVHVETTAEAS